MAGELKNTRRERQTARERQAAWEPGRVSGLWLVVLAAVCACMLSGCSVMRRVKYELSGAGLESWENAAVEEGIVSEVEEYYYDHLPEELREAYREIYVHVMRNEDKGDFYAGISGDEFWEVYYGMLADHPEIFWLGTSAQIASDFTGRVVGYELEAVVPEENRAPMREELEAAADACIAQIPPSASDYERIRTVYEYLINTVEYQSGSADSQNIQSALLFHASVCAGYSRAFQYILHRMGLFCTYITGQIVDGGDHGWNMVRIGGNYYYVDVTWGDPVFAGRMDSQETDSVINYNYLCCTEDDLFRTHVPGDSVELPPCTSDDYNYYKLNGCYYETFDYDAVHDALMRSVWNGETAAVLKFGSQEAYETAKYELFEGSMLDEPGRYLMEMNGVTTWNYRYHTDDLFWLITIYW